MAKNLIWNVLNYNPNAKKLEEFNIFNNYRVSEHTEELCKNYKKKKMTFEEFVKELDDIIRWQMWSRREYELYIGDAFETDINKFEKVDCYRQAHMNIERIAKYVMEVYNLN